MRDVFRGRRYGKIGNPEAVRIFKPDLDSTPLNEIKNMSFGNLKHSIQAVIDL
jgi:hypothetical protein